MKRDYNTGESDEVVFFIGNEVEHTPAYGMKTLFVTGLQSINSIEEQLSKVTRKDINHIFFGANHSYNPSSEEHQSWEDTIQFFLDKDYLCSLDIPMNQVEDFNDSGLNENDNFIPQIRVPIPYIRLWNYNTMLKIDDRDFKSTNPGVWSHSLHTLMDRKNFTDWEQYKKDEILK
jgi:hypothetical protein